MKRLGDIRVQCDHWPLTHDPQTPHVLTVIIAVMYDDKPPASEIAKVCKDAALILSRGE